MTATRRGLGEEERVVYLPGQEHRRRRSRRRWERLPAHEVEARFELVEKAPVLYTLPQGTLRALVRRMRRVDAHPGELLLEQGRPSDVLYVVESGCCEVLAELEPGNPVSLTYLRPGDICGAQLASGGEASDLTVRIAAPTTLLALDREALLTSLLAEPGDLLDRLATFHLQRLETASAHLQRLAATTSDGAEVVGVYSPSGGAGKTLVAVNLAAALAQRHPSEVVLFDLSLPFNRSALLMNLIPTGSVAEATSPPEGASFEEMVLSAALYHPGGMMVVPAAVRPEEADLLNAGWVQRALEELARAFSYVVIDLGVAMSECTLAAIDKVDDLVLVTNPDIGTVNDTKAVHALLTDYLHVPSAHVHPVLNHRNTGSALTRQDVEASLGRKVVLEIPYDGPRPDAAGLVGDVLFLKDPKSEFTRAAAELAQLLDGTPALEREG